MPTSKMPKPADATKAVYVAAAGDIGDTIAAGGFAHKTARVLEFLDGLHSDYTPGDGRLRHGLTVLPLGDLAYQHGSAADFAATYDKYWGAGSAGTPPYTAKKAFTWPTVGNHEAYCANITPAEPQYSAYDDEFGLTAQGMSTNADVYQGFYPGRGNAGGRYYARDIVAPDGKSYWMHIVLNSHKGETGGEGAIDNYTRELNFLDAMIANAGTLGPTLPTPRVGSSGTSRHPGFAQHLLVTAHHPLMAFSRKIVSGTATGSNGEPDQDAFWMKLQAYHGGIKLLLAGHYHYYVRCEPVKWKALGASVGDPLSSISSDLVNGVVLILNGIGGTNSQNVVGDAGAHNNHIQQAISNHYLVSHLMLEPTRATVEGVAIDDPKVGGVSDGPAVLAWSATAGGPAPSAALALDTLRKRLTAVTVGGDGTDRDYAATINADASGSVYDAPSVHFTFAWGDGTTTGPQTSPVASHIYRYNHNNAYKNGWGRKTVTLTVTDTNGADTDTEDVMIQRDHMLLGLANGGV